MATENRADRGEPRKSRRDFKPAFKKPSVTFETASNRLKRGFADCNVWVESSGSPSSTALISNLRFAQVGNRFKAANYLCISIT
jgi:hypothetical protein